ncbi:MAG: enoyl-CoA hydratase [Rubricoccaceae bacterium]
MPPNASPDATLVRSDLDGHVLRLTLARPEKKNALTRAMYAELARALAHAADDPAVRVALLAGEGGAFTAGNDLGDFVADPPADDASPVFQFLRAVSQFPKPLVAAVEGPAIGIGTTVLLHCDLVYAAPGARFQLPFVRLGLVPEAASSLLLPLVAGYVRAAEWLLLGEPFSAEDARAAGLVNDVVPEVRAHALERARALAALPPRAVRQTKALLGRTRRGPVAEAIRAEAERFTEALRSPEAHEAFTAFFEKRPADFSAFEG